MEEKKKLVVLLPGLQFLNNWVMNWTELIVHLAQKFNVLPFSVYSNNIYSTRNKLQELVFNAESQGFVPDYVLMMDDDNILTIQDFDKLLEDLELNPTLTGILAWYWIQAQVNQNEPRASVGSINDDNITVIPAREMFDLDTPIIPCEYGGLGGFLCKWSEVKKLGKTPFDPVQLPNGSIDKFAGDDVSFFFRAKEMGMRIAVDKRVKLPHFKIRDAEFDSSFIEALKVKPEIEGALYISGWMTPEELNWLYKQAKNFEYIAEIGSWKGRSAYALASGNKKGIMNTVYCIDTFKGSIGEMVDQNGQLSKELSPFHAEVLEKDIKKVFEANTCQFNNIQVIQMKNEDACKYFDDEALEMVFIDGDHRKEEVLKDIRNWLPKTSRLLCGHDLQIDGVRQALEESGLPWKHATGSIWYVDIQEYRNSLKEEKAA